MHRPETDSKVISLFASRKKIQEDALDEESQEFAESFDDVMERNTKNRERLRKERLNANKSVLRSYRIKH
jgi:hypothetical protein